MFENCFRRMGRFLVIVALTTGHSVACATDTCDAALAQVQALGWRARSEALLEYFDRIDAVAEAKGTRSPEWFESTQQAVRFSHAHPYSAGRKARRYFGRRQMRLHNPDKWAVRAGASWGSFIAFKDEATRQMHVEKWNEAMVLCGVSEADGEVEVE